MSESTTDQTVTDKLSIGSLSHSPLRHVTSQCFGHERLPSARRTSKQNATWDLGSDLHKTLRSLQEVNNLSELLKQDQLSQSTGNSILYYHLSLLLL